MHTESQAKAFDLQNPDPAAVVLLRAESAEKLCAVPFRFSEKGLLCVAMANPDDMPAIEEIRMLTGRSLAVERAETDEIRRAVSRFYKIARSVGQAMQERADSGEQVEWLADTGPEHLNVHSPDDAPVIKLLNDILERSVAERASDVHIEPGETRTNVRFRVDGALNDIFSIPVELHAALLARVKIKAHLDIAEKRRPQDGRIMAVREEQRIDIRVSTIPTVHGEKAVLRILDQDAAEQSIAALGFSGEQQEALDALLHKRHGICLVTGPTGSGKSTTLYALLQRLNNAQVNIVTVEDPVEYTIAGITQVQVNEKIGLSFSSLLRSVLRQDPDVIMVGEIRDTETAQLAVRAALTGHLVLATLHTNDAPSAVGRLLDMDVPAFLLASSLNGVIAQRLVRKLCPQCKSIAPRSETPGISDLSAQVFYHAVGCPACRRTGYTGRTAVAEIMLSDDTIREMVNALAPAHQIRAYAERKGMQPLFENAMERAALGITDLYEVYALGST